MVTRNPEARSGAVRDSGPGRDPARILGLILAGGAGSRLGGRKPLRPLAGRPVIAHVIDRLRSEVAAVVLSTRGNAASLRGLGLDTIEDKGSADLAGPLAGIVAGLRFAAAHGFDLMAAVPCDAPFLPLDLVTGLWPALAETGAPAAIMAVDGVRQPVIGLWRAAALPAVEAIAATGVRKLERVCLELGAAIVEAGAAGWPASAFHNINTPDDLGAAEAAAAGQPRPALVF